jgi:hypothetical protein
LPAAERIHGAIVLFRAKPQAVQNLLDTVIDVVGIVIAEQLVEPIVAACQGLALSFLLGAGECLGGPHHVVVRCNQVIEGQLRFLEQRLAWGELRLLAEQGDASAGMEANLSIIRPVEAGEKAQERCLAHAVGANQANALAGVKLEPKILEEGAFVKAAGETRAAQQDHDDG